MQLWLSVSFPYRALYPRFHPIVAAESKLRMPALVAVRLDPPSTRLVEAIAVPCGGRDVVRPNVGA